VEPCLARVNRNLQAYPESPWTEYWSFLVGQIQFRLWDYETAKKTLESVLTTYPNGDYAEQTRAYLNRIDPPWEIDANGIVRYSGKLEDDIRLQAAMKKLPDYIGQGFATLKKRLGVDLKPHARIVYSFKDAGPRTSGGLKATTRIIGIDNKPTTVIFFYAEKVVTHDESFRKTTVHEMKHAGFLGLMGQSYHNLPKWVREGLALWGSEDIETRVQLVLCNQITGAKDPLTVLDGIEDVEHNDRDYLEDALAFEWLATKNPENVEIFCRRLLDGEPYREIWADLSGLEYAEAMTEANAYCKLRVVEALGEGYAAFKPLRETSDNIMKRGAAATRNWLKDGGEAAFQAWFADHPGHAAEPMARISLARALVIAREFDEGRVLLHRILQDDGYRSTLMDDAQFWLGVSYNYQRNHPKAREAFGVLLRDYPNSSNAKQVRGKMPVAGPVTR
ncbi:MAG: tetratricopeptide repeat protein, partial [Verrucomicrobiota bacterium]